MKLVACLIWYDESPEDLRRAVLSLRGFADAVVAVDGAFARFPREESPPWSESVQLKDILRSAVYQDADGNAVAGNMEVLAYQPPKAGVWPGGEKGNEVEKRNASLHMAGWLGADWVINCDADMYLLGSKWMEEQLAKARELLMSTPHDVATVAVGDQAVRCCFRWSPTLHYERAHYLVKDGGKLLACPISSMSREQLELPPLVDALDLTQHVLFNHPAKQAVERRKKQAEWYRIRDRTGIEAL